MFRPAAGALILLLCGCRVHVTPAAGADAALDVAELDAPEPLALDFTVTGCGSYDPAVPRCSGPPPLTLGFAPVSSPSLVRFLWTFGDGTPDSSERAPSHTYVRQGNYDVTVIGASDAGTVSRTRRQLVRITSIEAGAPCDVDAQCATGLSCLCGVGAGCDPAFTRGICTAPCTDGLCRAGTVCADLGVAATSDGGAPTPPPAASPDSDPRRPLCLLPCETAVDCPPGLLCRWLSGSGAPGQPRWVQACFVATPADIGQPCRDPGGALADAACASGSCVDLGALGLCAATCGPGAACPAGSACATLGDGRSLCLAACDPGGQSCARDPLLACTASGGTGPLGFTVSGGATGATYCAPRACATSADCSPTGACPDGHCVRASN